VGGLLTLVNPGVNGQLVASRSPDLWAASVDEIVAANANGELSRAAVRVAQQYTWRSAAESLARLVSRMLVDGLVHC
jgi:glycosyltransferase involved in cell wall biosynthesis